MIKQKSVKRIARRSTQTHDHEFEGSTKLAEQGADRYNHRFAGVTGQVIPVGNSHVHEIDLTHTDFLNHFHNLKKIRTGRPISRIGCIHLFSIILPVIIFKYFVF